MPEALYLENEDPFFIYTIVVNQAIFAGMGTAIDLDFNSLKFIMDLYEIENQRDCFERVLKLWHEMAKLNKSGN